MRRISLIAISAALTLACVASAQVIAQAEYFIDTDPGVGQATPAAITPGVNPTFGFRIPAGVSPGLHKLVVRYRETNSYWSGADGRFFFELPLPTVAFQALLVTDLQYWFDSNAPVTVDVTDGAAVAYATRVSTTGLLPGLHRFYFRWRDNTGVWSAGDAKYFFIVGSQPSPEVPQTLTAAEYFINYDPGPGNGVPLVPDDGVWDEPVETTTDTLANIPSGSYWVGIRYRDQFGRWSATEQDTLFVGPLLTIRFAGNDVTLDWLTGLSTTQNYIYRGSTSSGSYTLIDSTSAHTYTDPGILNTNSRGYYYVRDRTSSGAFSAFRWPPPPAVTPR